MRGLDRDVDWPVQFVGAQHQHMEWVVWLPAQALGCVVASPDMKWCQLIQHGVVCDQVAVCDFSPGSNFDRSERREPLVGRSDQTRFAIAGPDAIGECVIKPG